MCSTVTSRHYERKQERKSKPEVSVTLWRQQQPLAWSRYHLDDYEGPSSWLWTLSPPHDSDSDGDDVEATEANKGPKTRQIWYVFSLLSIDKIRILLTTFLGSTSWLQTTMPVSQPAYWRHVKNLWRDVDNDAQRRPTKGDRQGLAGRAQMSRNDVLRPHTVCY